MTRICGRWIVAVLPLVLVAAWVLGPTVKSAQAVYAPYKPTLHYDRVQIFLGSVMERDSSTYVYFQGRAPAIGYGQITGFIPVNNLRQWWTNSQGCTEWTTLPRGTTYVQVDRSRAASGRQLIFSCIRYEYRWVLR
jgi:hypothetical protein